MVLLCCCSKEGYSAPLFLRVHIHSRVAEESENEVTAQLIMQDIVTPQNRSGDLDIKSHLFKQVCGPKSGLCFLALYVSYPTRNSQKSGIISITWGEKTQCNNDCTRRRR